jgi:hypothetical protein
LQRFACPLNSEYRKRYLPIGERIELNGDAIHGYPVEGWKVPVGQNSFG